MPRGDRPAFVAIVAFAATLAGCVDSPFVDVHFHDLGGDADVIPIHAVETGRRLTFATVTITDFRRSKLTRYDAVRLVERQDGGPSLETGHLPVWTGASSLRDQAFLANVAAMPGTRDPRELSRVLDANRGPLAWDAGYVVATRPLIVAFTTAETTVQPARTTRPKALPNRSNAGRPTWVEPSMLARQVDTVQVVDDHESTPRVVRLETPLTIDALLNLLASPGGLESHVAEELRQARPISDLEPAIRERDVLAIPRS